MMKYYWSIVETFDLARHRGDARYSGRPTGKFVVDLGLPGPRPRSARKCEEGIKNANGEIVVPARLNFNEGVEILFNTRDEAQEWIDETERLLEERKPSPQVKPKAKTDG